jgi:putative transposase
MSDLVASVDGSPAADGGVEGLEPRVDGALARELVERARSEGVGLVGPGGLLTGLTKTVLETALEAEMDEHLGYARHAVEGRNSGNSRIGTRSKTVLTEIGEVEIEVPRDRDGSFEPRIVAKRQRRLAGVDELVVSLAAKGLTTGEISAHLADVYGAEVSRTRSRASPTGSSRSSPSGSRGRSTASTRSCSSTRSTSRSRTGRSSTGRCTASLA